MSDAQPKPESAHAPTVPEAVVSRLSLYLRELQQLVREGKETTSSSQLGSMLGFTDAQVRKDLAYFGQFGHPGIGYRCDELVSAIRRILGTDRTWLVAIVGVGNLGRALLGYKGFSPQGFRLAAAFDIEEDLAGMELEGVPVYHFDDVARIVAEKGIQLGVITVPSAAAQAVADKLVGAGIEGIVNFAPVTITLPPEVSLIGVDMAIQLEQIAFSVVNRQQSH